MEIQTLVIIISASINLALILLYQRSRHAEGALAELIMSSPAVCFMCKDPYHDEEDPDDPHPYIRSFLVYVPDEHLR